MRGYRLAHRAGKIETFRAIKSDIADSVLNFTDGRVSKLIFGCAHSRAEVVIRQFIIDKFGTNRMYRSFLYSIGNRSKMRYPLPRDWQKLFVERGTQVDTFLSSAAWHMAIILVFLVNLIKLLNLLRECFLCRGSVLSCEPYAFFYYFEKGYLPTNKSSGAQSYDLCNWYARWPGRDEKIRVIRHCIDANSSIASGLRVEKLPCKPYSYLKGNYEFCVLIGWSILASLIAFVDLFRGRWWHALLLAEAGRARALALSNRNRLAEEYFFLYQGTVFRPLWTYEAEKMGCKIALFFGSISEQPKTPLGYSAERFHYSPTLWPTLLVWDHYQESQMRRSIGDDGQVIDVGPIWLSDNDCDAVIPSNSIAVFDVQPHRVSLHVGNSTSADYLLCNPHLYRSFMLDIYHEVTDLGMCMVWKRKRAIGKRQRKDYAELQRRLLRDTNVVSVNPTVSPFSVVQRCRAALSFPFTSTSVIANKMGVPTAYYDPTGWIQKDDRAAHGIPVLTGRKELRNWLQQFRD